MPKCKGPTLMLQLLTTLDSIIAVSESEVLLWMNPRGSAFLEACESWPTSPLWLVTTQNQLDSYTCKTTDPKVRNKCINKVNNDISSLVILGPLRDWFDYKCSGSLNNYEELSRNGHLYSASCSQNGRNRNLYWKLFDNHGMLQHSADTDWICTALAR